MTTLAVLNPAPASGKTTTVAGLAWYLGSYGARVLAIDGDPQGDMTAAIGRATTLDLHRVLQSSLPLAMATAPAMPPNVDMVSASGNHRLVDAALHRFRSPQTAFADALGPAQSAYNYVILDCSAALPLLTTNALAAADVAIVPVACEPESVDELARLMAEIDAVKRRYNPDLRVQVLLTMAGADAGSRTVAADLRGRYRSGVYATAIPTDGRLVRVLERRSIFELHTPGAQAYARLTAEIAGRLASQRVAAAA